MFFFSGKKNQKPRASKNSPSDLIDIMAFWFAVPLRRVPLLHLLWLYGHNKWLPCGSDNFEAHVSTTR